MTPPRSARSLALSARLMGATAAVAGLVLVALPPAAHADAPETHEVDVIVSVQDGDESAPLAGVRLTVRDPYGDGAALGSGTTGPDGSASLEFVSDEAQAVVDAVWPGASGDLDDTQVSTEFVVDAPDPVAVTFWGGHGVLTGTIAATVGDDGLSDVSGARLAVSSGGTLVQQVPLAADGTFTTGALPTSASADYAVALLPPPGHALAPTQPTPNPPFALPRGDTSPAAATVDRSFALVTTTPTPAPTPTPTATPSPAPTPGPTASTPPRTAPNLVVGTNGGFGVGLGPALSGISESDLDRALGAIATPGQATVLTNPANQVLGLAMWFPPAQTPPLQHSLSPVTQQMPGVTPTGGSLAAMSLETALMMVQQQRTTLLAQQLADQIRDVQARNTTLGTLNTAVAALDAYVADPTGARFDAAVAAVRATGTQHPFLDATAANGIAHVETLRTQLTGQIDSVSNSQQMDMLRLQSLSNQRNEAFDVMTDFIKRMQESRSSIIGNMRSTPIAIGSVQWDRGTVTGSFDLRGVTDGTHHLILDYRDLGMVFISEVTVNRGRLAATGGEGATTIAVGAGLLAAGAALIAAASVLRRRTATAS